MDNAGWGLNGGRGGGTGDGSLSPCARGRAREGDAWQAGLVAAPAPAAPGVEEEDEGAVLELGPLDTTTHTKWIDGPLALQRRMRRPDRGVRIYNLSSKVN